MIAERTGKAIRVPSRDTILSGAAKEIGVGWGFGVHEAMDTTGALLGPLAVAAVLYFKGSYQTAFFALLVPAILTMVFFLVARLTYPQPHGLERAFAGVETHGFSRVFWLYIAAICCIGMGYADFPLIAYHFMKMTVIEPDWIPIFYAVAMGAAALAALIAGRLFDRIGFSVLIVSAALASLFAPLAFLGGFGPALLGTALWGIGMGTQESIMRSAIVSIVPMHRLGFAYGILNTSYGLLWFAGSAIMGVLYDFSINYLVGFSVVAQLASIPILLLTKKQLSSDRP